MIILLASFVGIGVFWLRLRDTTERWAIDDWIDRWEPEDWPVTPTKPRSRR